MWGTIANLKENLNKIAMDVHQGDVDDYDEEREIYDSGNGVNTPVSDRRNSHSFACSKSAPRSPLSNGIDSPLSPEIEQYKAEIKRLQESEAEIKALSVNYAALLKEKESTPLGPPPPPPPWFPLLLPEPWRSSAFWETSNVYNQLKEFQETLSLAEKMQKELEILMLVQDNKDFVEEVGKGSGDSVSVVLKYLGENRIDLESQEKLSVEAAICLMAKLKGQLEPFRFVADEMTPWEEKSVAFRLANKAHKSKRNKLWRKRKRKHIAEMLAKERERFEQADQKADEWRAREIAKDIAKHKVEKMNEIAKLKEKEERKRLESEVEQVLIVEKLQELRSIRIQKLKKQGHFLPEEDDKFLERVRAAVEEEERQVLAAADTDAAKDAIATAEESRKPFQNNEPVSQDGRSDDGGIKKSKDQITESKDIRDTGDITDNESAKNRSERQDFAGLYDSVANLPIEFYHYYHGSNTDMGTLIEVRRTWDVYIRPGGSRIPGHWVQPPPPADEIWASYLVRPK